MRVGLFIFTLAMHGVLGCSGCSSGHDNAQQPSDTAIADAGGDSGGRIDSAPPLEAAIDAGSGECASAPPPPPAGLVPAGWVPFTVFSCEMPLYIPQTKAQLPTVEWEPCGSDAPTGISCRRMKLTAPDVYAGSVETSVVRAADGSHRMIFNRGGGITPPNTIIVSTLDGDVHFAATTPVTLVNGLSVGPAGIDSTHFGVRLRGGVSPGVHADDQSRKGVLVGTIGELRPKLFAVEDTPDTPTWRVNDFYVSRGAALGQTSDLFPLAGGSPIRVFRGADDPDGAQLGIGVLFGRDYILSVGNLRYAGILAYDPVRGPHALIRWPGDNTQGAIGPATDGKDLVWTYGTDHPPGEGNYAKRSLMTAPYSTDPDFVRTKARRLRSNPAGLERTAVGCGYAAHVLAGSLIPEPRVEIVRLSDGFAWNIPAPEGKWMLMSAIGMTCDEVLFQANTYTTGKTLSNIYRVRIDSLGTPSAPD